KHRKQLTLAFFCALTSFCVSQATLDEGYLNWSLTQAETIAQSTYQDGKVGSRVLLAWTGIDTRVLKTERAQNYKLRATWFTPEVIRGSARAAQLRSRLSADETRKLVAEAETAGNTVIMVEIDPNQGSGVIPDDWEAFLQPHGNTNPEAAIRGKDNSDLRKVRALQGVRQRNYDYDRFWMVFPLLDDKGKALLPPEAVEVDLVVRIYNREGTVQWTVPPSVHTLVSQLQVKRATP
ncbi:MAG TPA: hypothetical protein VMZ25_00205, partial [Terriglobales bacterium]|nr:hypothetical protein [Terriglobales bacterium]